MGSKRKRKQNKGHEFRNNRQQYAPAPVHKNGSVIFSNPLGADAPGDDKDSGPFQRIVNGQREAFPGLDDIHGDTDGDFLGPANDGLQYLRMVRSEAKGVPNLLLANPPAAPPPPPPPPPPSITDPRLLSRPIPTKKDLDLLCYDDDPEELAVSNDNMDEAAEADGEEHNADDVDVDSNGPGTGAFYSDGAYVAAPTRSTPLLPSQPTHPSLKQLPLRAVSREWHDGIVTKFRTIRERLQLNPPLAADIEVPRRYTGWINFMARTEATPSNMMALSSYDAVEGLKRVTRSFRRGSQVDEAIGKWTWALLLRCNDAGILRNEEIGVIRDLGKRASWLLGGWAEGRIADPEENAGVGDEEEREWWADNELPAMEEEEGGCDEFDEPMEADEGNDAKHESEGDEEEQEEQETTTPIKLPTVSPLMLRPRSVKVPASKVLATAKSDAADVIEPEPVDSVALDIASKMKNLIQNDRANNQQEKTVELEPTDAETKEPAAFSEDGTSQVPPVAEKEDREPELPLPELPAQESQTVATAGEELADESAPLPPSSPAREPSMQKKTTDTPVQKPTLQTLFTLDVILSVVGDVFGQKDLLLERR